MDFTKFVALLENAGLFFARASSLDDPFEGSYSRANETLRPQVYTQAGLSPETQAKLFAQFGTFSREVRKWVLVNCWHMNEHESAAMWKLYAATNEAVCVRSTYQRLRDVLSADVEIGEVSYIDYETDWSPEGNFFYPFLHKRKSFQHERELRAIKWQDPPGKGESFDFSAQAPDAGLWVPVDLNSLIERIYVAPAAPQWFAELVRKLVHRYAFEKEVRQSALDAEPFF